MDQSNQFVKCNKVQPIEKCSSFYMMVENFYDSTFSEELLSKRIQFLNSDDVWWISIRKENALKSCLTFFLQASDYILKSGNWYWSVAGTISGNLYKTPLAHIVGKNEHEQIIVYHLMANLHEVSVHLELDLKMTLSKTETPSNVQKFIDTTVQCKNIISNNKYILTASKYSDYTFIVQGTVFKVHKNILAASSSVFEKLFANNFRESSTNECHVKHIEPIIFKYLLSFIYCGELPETIHDENVSQKLFQAAHYYRISELVNVCTSVEHYKLSKDNAVDMYEWAHTYNLELIKVDAWKIIQFDILEICVSKVLPPPHSIHSLIAKKEEKDNLLKEYRLKLGNLDKDLLQ